MTAADSGIRPFSALTLVLAAALGVAGVFLLQSPVGLGMPDEGYLWYGVQETLAGRVPRVDFRSYDPPRVYWVSLWTDLFGGGPLALRASLALLQFAGLALGLLLVNQLAQGRGAVIVFGVTALIWMYPRHKYFEPAVAMAGVYVGTLLLADKRVRSYLWAGLTVGVATSFRRNLALYMSLSIGGLMIYNWLAARRLPVASVGAATMGFIVGIVPLIVLSLLIPGFAEAYLESIEVILQRGSTNQQLPIPWPWLASQDQGMFSALQQWGIGVAFVLYMAFFPIAAAALWHTRKQTDFARSALMASFAVALPFAHHALTRADLSHLAQSVHPVLLGYFALAALPRAKRPILKVAGAGLLLALTVLGPLMQQPVVKKWTNPQNYEQKQVLGDTLWVTRRQLSIMNGVENLLRRSRVETETPLLLVPYYAGYYAAAQLRSPIWDNYPIWAPTDEETAQEQVEELTANQPEWIVISRGKVLGGTTFAENHPHLMRHIELHYRKARAPAGLRGFDVYRRRSSQRSDQS